MSSVVKNNLPAQLALGELNKNISKLGAALTKVSSGMKFNSAGDDSAQFAISELMRVRIRALEQACQNIQNGNSLLRVAEEGIQQQIDIMRTIKEKVIDAANDHNTDEDRKILQKEINQYYDQIGQVAHYADYNIQKPLLANTRFNEQTTEWDETIPAGDYQGKRVTSWITNLTDAGKAKIVEGSDSLNLINKNNIIDTDLEYLDDGRPYVENGGPFDIFTRNISTTSKTLESLDNIKTGTTYYMTDGTEGDNKIISMDFSSFNSISDLDGLAFTVTYPTLNTYGSLITDSKKYVLSTDTSKNYASTDVNTNSVVLTQVGVRESEFTTSPGTTINLSQSTYPNYQIKNEIDISSCNSLADVATKLKSVLSSAFGDVAVSKNDATKIEFTSQNPNGFTSDTINNRTTITGFSANGGEISITSSTAPKLLYTHIDANKNVTLPTLSVTLSGGSNAGGEVAGKAASGSVNITASDNVYYIYGRFIKFVNGSNITTTSVSIQDPPFNVGQADMTKGTPPRNVVDKTISVQEVGINSSWSYTDYNTSCRYTMNNGKLEATAIYIGQNYNGTRTIGSSAYNLYFNYQTMETVEPGLDEYVSTSAAQTQDEQQAGDGDFAYYEIDFSKYVGNYNKADLEKVIQELRNINLTFTTNKTSYGGYYSKTYSFTDSSILNDLTSPGIYRLDLNNLRTSVESGDDIATALQNLFSSVNDKAVDNQTFRIEKTDSGIKINAYDFGKETETPAGSQIYDKGYFYTSIRGDAYYSYTLDFKKLFEENPGMQISDLYGKGFMAYCATCPSDEQPDPQWFNFYFTDNNLPPPISVEKPNINTNEDISDIPINLSKVSDVEGLIQAIYDQASAELNKINHHMFISADKNNGTVTLYESYSGSSDYSTFSDVRRAKNGTLYGAIIMDGYKDTAVPVTENYYADAIKHNVWKTAHGERRLVIQDTDKADMNITLHIPSTTLRDIFQDWCVENHENKRNVWEYSLVSKKDRQALLGNETEGSGAIDSALNYLLDASVMVGAQRARLEYAQTNVITQTENEMFSESKIRDADMAKEMTEYTKYNVLSQSAQSMLAQANQNLSQVLSLLQ